MSKLAQDFAKYMIRAKMRANGIIEKPDVIGAIFGQTEGLLGTDLDLRELQRTGRIGRIEVTVDTQKGKSTADILIPSSLDASETSLIAASLETIDKVGPCDAEVEISIVEDVRSQKRLYVVERAKEILRKMAEQGSPETQKISEMIKEAVRTCEVAEYQGLTCGPNIENEEEIIIVEGRADVINLLKNGVKNVIAIEGSKIPDAVIALTKEKTTTAFLDGDRGGELDLKKLLAVAEIDYVARAPEGKEVEELVKKQIFKALRDRIPTEKDRREKPRAGRREPKKEEKKEKEEHVNERTLKFLTTLLEDIIGTRAAYFVDKELNIISKVPISEIMDIIGEYNNIYYIVFDGKISQSIVNLAQQRKIKCIIGTGYKERVTSYGVNILTPKDLK